MKKLIGFLLVITSFFLINIEAFAEEDTTCNYKSKAALSKAAYNADANYTIKKR